MKKTILTIAIIFGIMFCASAQNGGLFGKGPNREQSFDAYDRATGEGLLNLPSTHGETTDVNAPLGGGALLLIGFGAAYALGRKRKEEQ